MAWEKHGVYRAFFLCPDSSGRTDAELTTEQYCTSLCLSVSSFLLNTIYITVIDLTSDHLDETSIYREIPLNLTVLLGHIAW